MSENTNTRRRRGGQPGNHNALKHGRYIPRESLPVIHNTAEDQITVIDHLIRAIKRQLLRTYAQGRNPQNLQEVLKTMNSLSLAAIGLCRLIHLYDRMTRSPSGSQFDKEISYQDKWIANLLAAFDPDAGGSLAG